MEKAKLSDGDILILQRRVHAGTPGVRFPSAPEYLKVGVVASIG